MLEREVAPTTPTSEPAPASCTVVRCLGPTFDVRLHRPFVRLVARRPYWLGVCAAPHGDRRAVRRSRTSKAKHHSAYHRLFSVVQGSLDRVGLAVFGLVEAWAGGREIVLTLDDTLARKRGTKRLFDAGMHHDPLQSSKKKAVMSWGHSWVGAVRGRAVAVCAGPLGELADSVSAFSEQEGRSEGETCVSQPTGGGGGARHHLVRGEAHALLSPRGRQRLRGRERAGASAAELRYDPSAGARRANSRVGSATRQGSAKRPPARARRALAEPCTDAEPTRSAPSYRPVRPKQS